MGDFSLQDLANGKCRIQVGLLHDGLGSRLAVGLFFQSRSVFFVETGLAAFGLEGLDLDQDAFDLGCLLQG